VPETGTPGLTRRGLETGPGRPYTGTQLETADTAKGSLPVPRQSSTLLLGEAMETSASFEARSAPSPYPTAVLLIDEMGYLNLRPEQTNIFFKLMEERYRQRPTLITTNLDYAEWAHFLGNKALVDALLSRLRHHCHTVKIDGPSLRDPTP